MAVAKRPLQALPLKQLVSLLDLKENWNSYGAPPIDPGTLGFALAFLVRTMRDGTPRPAVLASPRGGLQLEWHEQGIDLEIKVLPGGRFRVYLEDLRTGEEVDSDEDFDLETAVSLAGSYINKYLHLR